MGPPKPSRKPPPHGMMHCQRNTPVPWVLKLKVSSAYGLPDVWHGESLHRLFADRSAFGVATGTKTPSSGIANECPTVQSAQVSIVLVELLVTYSLPCWSNCETVTLPSVVPWTALQKLLRAGVQP